MTTLYIPLHLPVPQAEAFLNRELRYRRVTSFKVSDPFLVIEHERLEAEDLIGMTVTVNVRRKEFV